MIDLKQGNIILPGGYLLSPASTETSFINSTDGSHAQRLIDNRGYRTYKLSDVPFEGDNTTFTIYFHNSQLTNIQVYFDVDSADAASESDYIARFLLNKIGAPPYTYNWGEMKIISDVKSDFSVLEIKYKLCL